MQYLGLVRPLPSPPDDVAHAAVGQVIMQNSMTPMDRTRNALSVSPPNSRFVSNRPGQVFATQETSLSNCLSGMRQLLLHMNLPLRFGIVACTLSDPVSPCTQPVETLLLWSKAWRTTMQFWMCHIALLCLLGRERERHVYEWTGTTRMFQ